MTDAERKAYRQAYYIANREAIKARVRAYAAAHKAETSARNKADRAANPDKHKAKSRAYYEAHREERIAYQTELHAKKREQVKAYKQQWHAKNSQSIKAKKKAYFVVNRDVISEKAKQRYAVNPTPWKERSKAYRTANPEKARSLNKVCGANYRAEHREQLKAKNAAWSAANLDKKREYSARHRAFKRKTQVEKVDLKQILRDAKGLCGICKKPLDLFGIDFDHIIPLARGGTHTTANIQATHARCNRAKGAKVAV